MHCLKAYHFGYFLPKDDVHMMIIIFDDHQSIIVFPSHQDFFLSEANTRFFFAKSQDKNFRLIPSPKIPESQNFAKTRPGD